MENVSQNVAFTFLLSCCLKKTLYVHVSVVRQAEWVCTKGKEQSKLQSAYGFSTLDCTENWLFPYTFALRSIEQ